MAFASPPPFERDRTRHSHIQAADPTFNPPPVPACVVAGWRGFGGLLGRDDVGTGDLDH